MNLKSFEKCPSEARVTRVLKCFGASKNILSRRMSPSRNFDLQPAVSAMPWKTCARPIRWTAWQHARGSAMTMVGAAIGSCCRGGGQVGQLFAYVELVLIMSKHVQTILDRMSLSLIPSVAATRTSADLKFGCHMTPACPAFLVIVLTKSWREVLNRPKGLNTKSWNQFAPQHLLDLENYIVYTQKIAFCLRNRSKKLDMPKKYQQTY